MSQNTHGGAVAWEIDLSSAARAPPPARRSIGRTSASTTSNAAPAASAIHTTTVPGSASVARRAGAVGHRPAYESPTNAATAADHGNSMTLPRLAGTGGARTPSRGGRSVGVGGGGVSSRAGLGCGTTIATIDGGKERGRASTNTTSTSRTAASRTTRPAAVVSALHAPPSVAGPTAKGAAVRDDLAALDEECYGGAESRPPAKPAAAHESALSDGSPWAKSHTFYTDEAVPRAWTRGPRDTAGRFVNASNSNLFCLDVLMSDCNRSDGANTARPAVCVTGSADHGLKVFDLTTLRERRTLYNRTYGHTEWVTSCKFFSDGRVLSGGMDSKLCLWDSVYTGGCGAPARCQDLLGHTGSISQVDVNADMRAVSSAYDRTLRVWDCSRGGGGGGGGREVGLLAGHKAPVLQFDWCGTQVLSGDRQGHAKLWDLPSAKCVLTVATKRGQVGCVRQFAHAALGDLTMLSDQGGVLTVLDLRQGKRPICQAEVHPGGVVSGIEGIPESADGGCGPYIVTYGADKRICVLDPRRNFVPVHTFTDHTDFIYSMKVFGSLVVSGAGNGWVLVHDVRKGECCYGLGAGENAIRDVFPSPAFLVAASDDGKAVVYDY